MSGDPEQEYFSDGITEDIITELSRFRSLIVIARNSTFAFKGQAIDVVEVAKKHAKKIIICEPVAVKPQDIKAHDFVAKMAIYIAKFLPERLLKIVDFFFADNDGINSYERRSEWKHDEKSLVLFYKNLGFTKIFNINDNYIGIWEE